MNVKLVQRIEVCLPLFSQKLCCKFLLLFQYIFCINTTTQVFCYNEFFVKNIFSVH